MKKTCFPAESEGLQGRELKAQKMPQGSLGVSEDFLAKGGGCMGAPWGTAAKPGSILVQGGCPACEC